MQRRATTLLAVACLAGAGCGDDGSTTAPTAPSAAAVSTSIPASTSPPASSPPTTSTSPDGPSGRALDCGEDEAALDRVGPPSVTRRCFADANAAGKPAELVVHAVGASGATTVLLRSHADRTVDVVPVDGGRASTCAGLATDERLVFRLAGCDPPLDE